MPLQCDNCESLFFKTLETRVLSQESVLLYKKRCKRCKQKALFKQQLPDGCLLPATMEQWLAGTKVELPNGKMLRRAQLFVSEYTRRISRPAEDHRAYLCKVRQAERIAHELPQAKNH